MDPSKSGVQVWKERRAERRARGDVAPGGVFGFSLEHFRAAAGFAGAALLGGGIGASTGDHSHHGVTYVLWYGGATLFVFAAVVMTRAIERRRLRRWRATGVEPGAARPIHVHIDNPGPHEVRDEGGRIVVRPITEEEARPPKDGISSEL